MCLYLVAVASIAFVHAQGYFVLGYHLRVVFSHGPSLVRPLGYGSNIDGG